MCYSYIFKMMLWMSERNSNIHKYILAQFKNCFTEGLRTLYYGVNAYFCFVALVKVPEFWSRGKLRLGKAQSCALYNKVGDWPSLQPRNPSQEPLTVHGGLNSADESAPYLSQDNNLDLSKDVKTTKL